MTAMRAKRRYAMILRDYRGFGLDDFRATIWGSIEWEMDYFNRIAGLYRRQSARDLNWKVRMIISFPPLKSRDRIDW